LIARIITDRAEVVGAIVVAVACVAADRANISFAKA
jgi:hypothetical protein